MKKRIFALALAFCMVLSVMPSSLAAGLTLGGSEPAVEPEQEVQTSSGGLTLGEPVQEEAEDEPTSGVLTLGGAESEEEEEPVRGVLTSGDQSEEEEPDGEAEAAPEKPSGVLFYECAFCGYLDGSHADSCETLQPEEEEEGPKASAAQRKPAIVYSYTYQDVYDEMMAAESLDEYQAALSELDEEQQAELYDLLSEEEQEALTAQEDDLTYQAVTTQASPATFSVMSTEERAAAYAGILADLEEVTLPECNCGQESVTYFHAATCPCYPSSLTNEQAWLVWQELSDFEKESAQHWFTAEQKAYFEEMEALGELREISEEINGCEVSVYGSIPEGVTLSLEAVEIDLEEFGIEDPESVIAALDIKLVNEDGSEWQPGEGESVLVTLDAEALGMSDGFPVALQHQHESEVYELGEYTVEDGKLTFETEGFSIFVVTGLWGVADTAYNQTVTMYVGDTLYFKCDTRHENRNHAWNVSANGIVSTATYTYPDGSDTTGASYVSVTAETVGTVILNCRNQDNSITINIIKKTGSSAVLEIDDQIYTNGCLVPVYTGDKTVASYKWYRNDELDQSGTYSEVQGEGLASNYAVVNGVNVAVDQGGKCWYKVEAYNAAGELIDTSDPYWVPYSNELENGSFETPNITGYNPFNNWGAGNVQFNQEDSRYITTAENVKNGTALWWRTTGVGSNNNADGRDIEIVRPGNATLDGAYYVTPDDGDQYAELNCEAVGTLYQDVLTAPNTTLKWSFSHLGREGTDTMAVVVMPANRADEYAERLMDAKSTADINNILTEIAGISGAEVWADLTADAEGNDTTPEWATHSGEYKSTDDQYLSRFFFVSVQSSSGSLTMGNLIDGVSFDDKMTYRIRYYVDGKLQETETGSAKPYTIISASKTDDYSEYALETVVKAENNTEYLDWGSTSMRLEYNDTYLDLHYVSTGISVTKEVVLTDVDDLTADEIAAVQEALWADYTATFALKNQSGDTVATANVSVNTDTGEGVALFLDSTTKTKFVPASNTTYTIVETSNHDFAGYTWTHEDVDVSTGNSLTASEVYTNSYKPGLADLTITKSGCDTTLDPGQTFIFYIKGTDDNTESINMTVVITGNGSKTITGLPVGKYTVTEDTSWSWRYTPEGGSEKTITLSASAVNTVTFTNQRDNDQWFDSSYSVDNYYDDGAVESN